MKKEDREEVEKFLDDYLKQDLIERVRWITAVVPLSDIRDIALGFTIGEATAKLHAMFLLSSHDETAQAYMSEVMNIIRKRLPELAEKIEKEVSK